MANNTRPIEYEITKSMYNALLGTRKEKDMEGNPYDYVMNLINEQFGLRGTVKHLHILREGY